MRDDICRVSLHTLPFPTDQGKFRDKFNFLQNKVFSSLVPKKIGGVQCDGEDLTAYLKLIARAINDNKVGILGVAAGGREHNSGFQNSLPFYNATMIRYTL